MPPRFPLFALLCAGLILPAAAGAEEGEAKPNPLTILHALDEGFVQVYEKVAPSVVIIDVTKKRDESEAEESGDF